MTSCLLLSKSTQETIDLGLRLAGKLRGGDILCLYGNLGTGKTTLIKGIAQGLKVKAHQVHSPTFVLMNIYEGQRALYHFDLYRLDNLDEISALGYEEFLYGEGISVIEWAEHLGDLTPAEYLKIELKHKGEDQRSIKVSAVGKRYNAIVQQISGKSLKGGVARNVVRQTSIVTKDDRR